MRHESFAAGEAIFKQGDKSEFVLFIKSGSVSIVRSGTQDQQVIARLSGGDVVGEMAAFENAPHSASAIAETRVEAEIVDREEFLHVLESNHELALTLLKSLAVRLRKTDLELVDARSFQHEQVKWTQIHLLPRSDRMAEQMAPNGLIVRNLPFRVGRHAHPREITQQIQTAVHLAVDERQLHYLERVHFAIEDSFMGPIVRDCGSRFGTTVNDVQLGGGQRHLSAPLRPGQNTIVAGPDDSPFRFVALVE